MQKNTAIDGIAACQAIDSSGEILDIEKLDISSLGADDSVFNYEHKAKENPSQVVGKVTFAKKIMKASDCDNDRERYWWKKFKKPIVYVKGELFDAEGHRGASEVAAMFRYKNRHRGRMGRRLMGLSIEGGTSDREGRLLGHSLARDVAITIKPCNKTCLAEIVEDDNFDLYKSEAVSFTDTEVVELIKEEHPEALAKKMGEPAIAKDDGAEREKFGKVTVKENKPKGFGKVIQTGTGGKPNVRPSFEPAGPEERENPKANANQTPDAPQQPKNQPEKKSMQPAQMGFVVVMSSPLPLCSSSLLAI